MADEPLNRIRWLSDPVPVIGTIVSLAVGVLFYLRPNVDAALATLAAITTTLLVLLLEILIVQHRQLSQATRIARLVQDAEQVPDLTERVARFIEVAKSLHDSFEMDTPAGAVIRHELDEISDMMTDLLRGRIPSDKNTFMPLMTTHTRRCLYATSLQAVDLSRWFSPDWDDYWHKQLEAMKRGVRIQRVFIYEDWTPELDGLARGQAAAGVDVRRVPMEKLVRASRPDLLVDIILWDETCGCQLLASNSQGEILVNTFTWAESDISRMRELYRMLVISSTPFPEDTDS